MGLDSVELVMAWEEFFKVEITDMEAEKISTIKDATDCISDHINFKNREADIKEDTLKRLNNTLLNLNVVQVPVSNEQLIVELIPFEDFSIWNEISLDMKYQLPSPYLTSPVGKIMNTMLSGRYDHKGTTVERFVELICAINFEKMLDRDNIRDKFEVLIGVMGMTIDKIGSNPYEVFTGSKFVHDLGID